MININRPLMLMILDGFGLGPEGAGNAISQGRLPNYRRLLAEYPHTRLRASGEAVGLPAGQMGNSEVGHLNIGAGRIVYQELTRISKAIRDGSFFSNEVLAGAVRAAREQGGALHLMGLVSDGGVHSHLDHLYALLDLAKREGLERVYIHAFLDGRDVPPASAAGYLEQVEDECRQKGIGAIATIMGRYYAMDRDRRWERTARAYRALVAGDGHPASASGEAIRASYERGITDEFVEPAVITRDGRPLATVREGDSVVFFNFRADRARQLTRAFVDRDFDAFERPGGRLDIQFVCLTQYDVTIPAPVAFPPQVLQNVLGEVIAGAGLKQLRIAETEKYAHVTFFFNGGVEEPFAGEDRLLIPSPKVATYDQKPAMSAREVTDAVLERLDKYDFIVLNFANPDMVGHTGDLAAAIAAVETVDDCIGRIVQAMAERRAPLLLTADHGNAEEMREPDGEPHTAHTSNLVPFILVDDRYRGASLREGALEDVAPTVLDILHIQQPSEMTGKSLIVKG
ncbi:2,3-bisphosphoglycerate-independent phosphoglycerate mutase [Moorella thermoacetica]|uniref:2,3-bisphosphoglycerate-independent phosphoglycerate mutase n=1 Tax=Neomoorella thermoacetica TaxID=1525 RepID=A0A1J5NJL8_NEOTH|nr:2,3-bisphosphoglycerate-independent phosphoglycerate mutase [Moorella thermoacetica]